MFHLNINKDCKNLKQKETILNLIKYEICKIVKMEKFSFKGIC